MRIPIVLSVFIFLAFAINGQTKPENTENWRQYSCSNFTVQYPSSWEINLTGAAGSTFAIISPVESDKDQFRENINLMVQDLNGTLVTTLSDFVNISEDQVLSLAPNGKLIKSEKTTASSKECQHFIFAFKQGERNLVCEQLVWIINNEAYVLTFTSEEDKYDEYKSIGKKLLSKFELN